MMEPTNRMSEYELGSDSPTKYVNLQGHAYHPNQHSVTTSSLEQRASTVMKSDANDSQESESMVFEESESLTWKSHHLKRFTNDRTKCITSSKVSTMYKWILVVLVGAVVALIGLVVTYATNGITNAKYNYLNKNTNNQRWVWAYTTFILINLGYATVAGLLCMLEPNAAGSGIPQIKAYLNGVNLHKLVRIRTLFAKVLGMVFSVGSGLPIGKEGPMIHAGSIVGAAVSQGKSALFGYDTSWTKYQDLRNDRSKRDFVTFGAAAGVAAAFSAPIGGVLFTLEEGASYWSASLTFRAFFCAMITELTVNLVTTAHGSNTLLGLDEPTSMFDFGSFDTFDGYYTYELGIFVLIGCVGGILGAFFNHYTIILVAWRKTSIFTSTSIRKVVELMIITIIFSTICFVVPLFTTRFCRDMPAATSSYTVENIDLVDELVQYQCSDGQYNQVASLYLTNSDITLQQLFHFNDSDGASKQSFGAGSLIAFFVPYFLIAIYTAGCFCPAGLFVPTLVSGAALGRFVGLILQSYAPTYFADEGTYALLGAAAILGGMSRMNICGTVIVLEACGNSEYLLPLMLVFAAARYTGAIFNKPLYDMQIHVNKLPYLDNSLPRIDLLNYHPISDITNQSDRPVRTIYEINKVGAIFQLLKETSHNAYPVVARNGQLRGSIQRKTLCSLLKFKAFAFPLTEVAMHEEAIEHLSSSRSINKNEEGEEATDKIASKTLKDLQHGMGNSRGSDVVERIEDPDRQYLQLNSHNIVFFETIERGTYPKYPAIESIELTAEENESWLDVRMYMDPSPHCLHSKSSIQRAYRYFRTLGLRHLIVIDNRHRVTGMLTRKDLTEENLRAYWNERVQRGMKDVGEFVNAELPQEQYEEFYYNDTDVTTMNVNVNVNDNDDDDDDDVVDLENGQAHAQGQDQGDSTPKSPKSPTKQVLRVVNRVFPVRSIEDLRKWSAREDAEDAQGYANSKMRLSFYKDKAKEMERGRDRDRDSIGNAGSGGGFGGDGKQVPVYQGSVSNAHQGDLIAGLDPDNPLWLDDDDNA